MSKRWTLVGAALGAVAILAGVGYYWLLRQPLARTQGALRLPGLQNEGQQQRLGSAAKTRHLYLDERGELEYNSQIANSLSEKDFWDADWRR